MQIPQSENLKCLIIVFFFEKQKEQSLIKSTIVAKYFDVWANVIVCTQKRYPQHAQKLAYIDLFAGPGRYSDGTQSTPLKILTNAIEKHMNNQLGLNSDLVVSARRQQGLIHIYRTLCSQGKCGYCTLK